MFGNFKRAISAISNNTVNGEGIFISGMKKNIEYAAWSTGKCHLNIADLFKKAWDFPGEKWACPLGDRLSGSPTKCETNYQSGVPTQINTVPLLHGTNF